MGISIQRTVDSGRSCERFLSDAAAHGKDVVWILSDYERTLDRRKQLAACDSELRFGCTVSMFTAWLDDLWALYGDGRLVVSAIQRKLLVKRVLRDAASAGEVLFEPNPGTIGLLCRMVQQGFGLDVFVAALDSDDVRLSETHRSMLRVAAEYSKLLKSMNLCERSESMRLLLESEDLEWPALACEGLVSLSPSEASFFARLSERADVLFALDVPSGSSFEVEKQLKQALERFGAQVELMEDARTEGSGTRDLELQSLSALLYDDVAGDKLKPGGALRALLPAGRYAFPSMLADEIALAEGSVLVVCNKPEVMFEELAPRLAARGVSVESSYMRPFEATDFGRTLLNACELSSGGRFDVAQASDFALSRLSVKGPRGVYELDASWRASRLADAAFVNDALNAGKGDPAGSFLRLVSQGRFEDAMALAEDRYLDFPTCKDLLKSEQLAAIKCARTVLEQARYLGEEFKDALDLLYSIKVGVRARSIVDDGTEPRVRIVSHYDAAQLAEASFDTVFACDLNASEQPLKIRRTSLDGLLDIFGIGSSRDALFESRLRMLHIVGAAKSRLHLVRVLNDEEARPLYPAVAFEEISSCYLGEPDKATGLAESLVSGGYFSHRGEEYLEENLGMTLRKGVEVLQLAAVAEVSEQMTASLLDPVRKHSASSIELYLDCPYKWFASRRLRLTRPDAGFSALERGSFLHEVLKDFYESYRVAFDAGKPQPNDESLSLAKPLFDEVFDAVAARQVSKKPGENPYIPLTQAELRQMEELRQHLFGFVGRDAMLLPGFEPRFFEYKFGYEEACEYAGVPVFGSIDRIDVDAQGRIAIVDYKSSLGDSYCLTPSRKDEEGECALHLPAKVQALIYAQVAKRLLGKQPVAALYVHALRPGSQPQVCGAYDDCVLGPDDIPGIKVARCAVSESGWGRFEDLLDGVEAAIGERLEQLKSADISIEPRDEASCSFCPVLDCEGRK